MAGAIIEIHSIADTRDWAKVFAMPRGEVCVDWWGRSLQKPFRYAIGYDPHALVYVAEVPRGAPARMQNRCGIFVSDLAEPETRGDTAELFLMHQDGRYCEVHLSADGAWWFMDFFGYRMRKPERVPDGVEVRIDCRESHWIGAIRVPLQQLTFLLDGSIRVQATLALCSGQAPVYVTSAGAPGFEPDFHDERCFARCAMGSRFEA